MAIARRRRTGNLERALRHVLCRPEATSEILHRTLLLDAVCDAAAVLAPAVTLTTFRDVPWNAPWYARRGFAVLPPERWGPEPAALVEHERALGIGQAPRVVMRKDLSPREDH